MVNAYSRYFGWAKSAQLHLILSSNIILRKRLPRNEFLPFAKIVEALVNSLKFHIQNFEVLWCVQSFFCAKTNYPSGGEAPSSDLAFFLFVLPLANHFLENVLIVRKLYRFHEIVKNQLFRKMNEGYVVKPLARFIWSGAFGMRLLKIVGTISHGLEVAKTVQNEGGIISAGRPHAICKGFKITHPIEHKSNLETLKIVWLARNASSHKSCVPVGPIFHTRWIFSSGPYGLHNAMACCQKSQAVENVGPTRWSTGTKADGHGWWPFSMLRIPVCVEMRNQYVAEVNTNIYD